MSFVKIIQDETFEAEVLMSSIPVLVDFWAEWCGPCRPLGKKLEEISSELVGKIKTVKIDVSDNRVAAEKYGVRGIPAMILFKDGVENGQLIGNHPKETIIEFISKDLR
jgi:thioredoxin 1